jgi:Zn finger protein HypA/HybF involved in hydrogenase expression
MTEITKELKEAFDKIDACIADAKKHLKDEHMKIFCPYCGTSIIVEDIDRVLCKKCKALFSLKFALEREMSVNVLLPPEKAPSAEGAED